MQIIILVASFVAVSLGGHIQHSEKATSYQNFEIEHHHAVPTYIKKEDQHLLQHPVSKGKTSSKVEVHHGGKYDHGYALSNVQNTHGHSDYEQLGGGHGQLQYEVQDQGQQQYVHYQPEEAQSDQQGYQTIDAAQIQHLAAVAAAKLGQQGYSGYQGVGHYEGYPQHQR